MGPSGGATAVPVTPPASLFPGITGALSAAGPGAIKTATGTLEGITSGVDVQQIYNSIVSASKQQEQTGQAGLMASMGSSGMASSSDAMRSVQQYQNQFQANLLQQLQQMQFQNEALKLSGAQGLMDTYANAGMAFAPTEEVVGNTGQSIFGQVTSAVSGAGMAAAMLLMAGCWIAAELYGGWQSLEVHTLRRFLATRRGAFSRSLIFLYVKLGQRVAKHIKTHPRSRKLVKAIFDRLLNEAFHWRFEQCLNRVS